MNVFVIGSIVFIVILVIIFALRKSLSLFLANSVHFIFGICLITALITLFTPSPTSILADFTLKQTGVYKQITDADKSLSPIGNIGNQGKNFIDTISGWFGSTKESATESSTTSEQKQGSLEKNLYPTLVEFLGTILRALFFIGSIVGMILTIYASFYTEQIRNAGKLEERVRVLENALREKFETI